MNQPSSLRPLLPRLASAGRTLLLATTAVLALVTASMPDAQAMDTDIFGATTSSGAAPNVLIILDNTSNWSRQDQHFPGGMSQGQAEADSIRQVINALPGNINVGLLEYASAGNKDTGGYVRFAVSPVGLDQGSTAATNRTNFSSTLNTIYNGITSPDEKLSSGVQYGDLMLDAYNYLSGKTPFAQSGNVPASLADSRGYTTNYTLFKSPLSDATSCATTFIIFIGNPPAKGPTADSAANLSSLQAAGGTTRQLPLPNFTATTQNVATNLGYSSACFASAPTTTPTDYSSQCTSFDSCSYNSADSTSILPACTTGARYSVVATSSTTSVYSTPTTTTTQNNGQTNSCYASSSNWSSATDTGTVAACPANTSTTSGNVTTNTTYSCSYAASSTPTGSSCGNTSTTTTGAAIVSKAQSNSCYANLNSWSSSDHGSLTCPATQQSSSNGTTTTTTYACNWSASDVGGSTASCSSGNGNGGKSTMLVTQTATPTTTVTGPTYKYPLVQTVTKTVQTITQVAGNSKTTLGNTLACYTSASSCSTSDYTCPAGSTCACDAPTTTLGSCPSGGSRYQVVGNTLTTVEAPTNPPTYTTDTNTFNSDEWARFLHEVGVPVGTAKQTVNTYTIDVYNAQPDAMQSSLLASMARAGGGKYFTATNASAIKAALTSIFSEIQAVNDTFASAALPISATNRAQNSNQVYIGMFRPDQGDHPRWYGNLKRYQVSNLSGFSGLAGADNKAAVSASTGFVTPCAVSWWTTDSGSYWYDTNNNAARIFITQATTPGTAWTTAGDDTNFAKGSCGNYFAYSDLADGPTVEKGAAAQMLRTQSSRKLYTAPAITVSNPSLTTFDASTTGISTNTTVNANVARFILGQDVTGEIGGTPSTASRPSIHGEVIHSRPLPVDYGGTTGVVIYYGAGDGVYHAVSGATGQELWGFVAPETYPQLQRLMDNSPLVQMPYPTPPGSTTVDGTTPKQFFFDGSTGVYQNSDNTSVWIYPAMRRGGRMLYGLDVTTPTTPTLKWRAGCPDLTDDNNCTSGMSGIGQTWSTPQVAKVNGYTSGGKNIPVVIVGGGYDACEDADTATPSCSSPKGANVYVLDAATGTVLATFATARSVIADIALVDTNSDGVADAAYAADLGGNLYRVDFPTTASGASDWKMTKVAYTNVTPSNKSRKFEFAPAVLPYNGKVYVALVSGDREHPLSASYPYTTPVVNRAYLYLDDPGRTTATDLDGALMQDNTTTAATCDTDKILPGSSKVGWHLDLNAYGKGEQGVTSAIIIGGMVSFSTNRPVVSGQTCTTSLGEARGYWLNLLNGSGAIGVSGTCGGDLSQTFVGGGLPPSPVAATVNVDGSQQTIVIGATCRDGSNCSPIQAQQVRPPISNKRRRTYWRTNSGDNH